MSTADETNIWDGVTHARFQYSDWVQLESERDEALYKLRDYRTRVSAAEDARDRYRKAIEDAPHTRGCASQGWVLNDEGYLEKVKDGAPCDCFKGVLTTASTPISAA